jgi:hypothetical protein
LRLSALRSLPDASFVICNRCRCQDYIPPQAVCTAISDILRKSELSPNGVLARVLPQWPRPLRQRAKTTFEAAASAQAYFKGGYLNRHNPLRTSFFAKNLRLIFVAVAGYNKK